MKRFRFISLVIAVVLISSCNNSISQKEKTTYFDIPKFIQTEANRLQQLNPLVTKTVSNEKSTEIKQLKISNWQKELSQFSNIDVNKSGNIEFIKKRLGDTLIFETPYNSKNLVSIKVIFKKNIPIALNIYRESKNLLYVNKETLNYSTGKTYSIDKTQHVKGIGKNRYFIKGEIH